MNFVFALVFCATLLLSQAPAFTLGTCWEARGVNGIKTLKSGPLTRRSPSCFSKEKKYDYDDEDYHEHYGRSVNLEGRKSMEKRAPRDVYYNGEYHYDGKGYYHSDDHFGGNRGYGYGGRDDPSEFFRGRATYSGETHYEGEYHSSEGNDGQQSPGN